MSWWDSAGITNIASALNDSASQALKNAQKKIDKALDIQEDEATKRKKGEKLSLGIEKKKNYTVCLIVLGRF